MWNTNLTETSYSNMTIKTSDTATTPVAKMLASFPDSRQKRNGWFEHPDAPRFDFREREDGSIWIHSWTGRSVEEILSMGTPPLSRAALYNGKATSTTRFEAFNRDTLDIFELSHYLKLDWKFLYQLGYSDGYRYTNQAQGKTYTCVKLGGYCHPDGTPYDKVKVRLSIDSQSKFRFAWDENTPGEPIPCGLHKLEMAREQGFLVIGEGESDWATMMFHGVPFIGIPGTGAYRSLDVSLLAGIGRVYILEEPDQVARRQETGKGFYRDMRSHLRAGGYTGDIFSIRFKQATGQKDPSELHKACYILCRMQDEIVHEQECKARFQAVLQEAMRTALPEGNDGLGDQASEPYVAPPPALPTSADEQIRFIRDLNAVESSILSPSHKITLSVIMASLGWFDGTQAAADLQETEGRQYWYHVDAGHLCKQAGLSRDIFLSNLSYLTNKLGLFEKKYTSLYYQEADGRKSCRRMLYIRPSDTVWLAYPSTYVLQEQAPRRKQGGLQQRIDKSIKEAQARTKDCRCIYCGSPALDRYELEDCQQCHEKHFIQIAAQPIFEQIATTTTATDALNSENGNLPSPLFNKDEQTVEEDDEQIAIEEDEENSPVSSDTDALKNVNSGDGNLPPILLNIYDRQLAVPTVYVFKPTIEDGLWQTSADPPPAVHHPSYRIGDYVYCADTKKTGRVTDVSPEHVTLSTFGKDATYETAEFHLLSVAS